jgi:outer membrane protein
MLNYHTLFIFLILASSPFTHATSLVDFYFEALKEDPRLASGEADVGISEAQKRQSLASLLPQVSLNNSISKNNYQSGTSDSINYIGKRHDLSLTQQLYNKELWLDNKIYSINVEQQKARLKDITSTIALDVTQRYVDILSAENTLSLTKSKIKSTQAHLKLLESRFKRQLAVKTDLLDVEVRLQALKIDEIDAKNSVLIAREGLTELVNREITESLDGFIDNISYKKLNTVQEFVDYALKHSDFLHSIESEVLAGTLNIKKQKAAHFPTLSFQLSTQRSNIGFENAPTDTTDSITARINLSVPIYSGGAINARTREYRERIVVTEQKLEQYKRQLSKSVRENYFNTESSWQRIEASRLAIDAATKSNQAMNKSFTYGTVTVVDVLDSLNAKLQAEHEFKQSKYNFIMSYIQLHQLAGKLDKDTMKNTHNWQAKTKQK